MRVLLIAFLLMVTLATVFGRRMDDRGYGDRDRNSDDFGRHMQGFRGRDRRDCVRYCERNESYRRERRCERECERYGR